MSAHLAHAEQISVGKYIVNTSYQILAYFPRPQQPTLERTGLPFNTRRQVILHHVVK